MSSIHPRQVPVEQARRDLRARLDGLFGDRGENLTHLDTITIVSRHLATLTRATSMHLIGRSEPAAEVMAQLPLDETPMLINLGEMIEQIKIIHPCLTRCELIMLLSEYQLETTRLLVRQERGRVRQGSDGCGH
jgi:hypothetical protein